MLHCPVCGMLLNKLSRRGRYFCFNCNREVCFGKNGTTVYNIDSEGRLRKWHAEDDEPEAKKPRKPNSYTLATRKAVVQIEKETMAEVGRYVSIAEASKMTGASASQISLCCRDLKHSAHGYVWRFDNVQER